MLPIFVIFLSLAVIGESAFVDTLTKCSKDDEACFAKLIQKIIHDIGNIGIPEFGMRPFDPYVLKNQTVSILDVNLSIDGVVKGIRNCAVNKFSNNFEHRIVNMDFTCDILVKGRYKVFSDSPLLKNLFGGENIHGEGDGKVKIERLNIKVTLPIDIKKKGDDIFLHGKRKKIQSSFAINGKILFAANDIRVGEKESSADIIRFMNEQSKFLIDNFGKQVFEAAKDIVYEYTSKFFTNTPTKYFIIEDLSPYAT